MRGKMWMIIGLLVTLTMVISPLAAAGGFFSLFRKEKSNAWAIDPSDFVKLMEAIEGRDTTVQIANFGVMEIVTAPEVNDLKVQNGGLVFEDAQIVVPPALSGYKNVHPQMISASRIRFTLYTAQINRFLSSLSIRAVVPNEINNKPFLLNTAPLIAFTYRAEDPLKADLVIAVTKPSIIEIPASVNPESLQEAILAIPGLPKGLQSQFANVSYNGKALIDPGGIGEPITIRPGIQGAFTTGPKEVFTGLPSMSPESEQMHREIQRSLNQKNLINGLWGMRFWADCLIWLDNGLIYMVMGQLSQEQALAIARMIG